MNRLNAMGLFICFVLGMSLSAFFRLAKETGSVYYWLMSILIATCIIFHFIIMYRNKKDK